jgi:hypothetical protein
MADDTTPDLCHGIWPEESRSTCGIQRLARVAQGWQATQGGIHGCGYQRDRGQPRTLGVLGGYRVARMVSAPEPRQQAM